MNEVTYKVDGVEYTRDSILFLMDEAASNGDLDKYKVYRKALDEGDAIQGVPVKPVSTYDVDRLVAIMDENTLIPFMANLVVKGDIKSIETVLKSRNYDAELMYEVAEGRSPLPLVDKMRFIADSGNPAYYAYPLYDFMFPTKEDLSGYYQVILQAGRELVLKKDGMSMSELQEASYGDTKIARFIAEYALKPEELQVAIDLNHWDTFVSNACEAIAESPVLTTAQAVDVINRTLKYGARDYAQIERILLERIRNVNPAWDLPKILSTGYVDFDARVATVRPFQGDPSEELKALVELYTPGSYKSISGKFGQSEVYSGLSAMLNAYEDKFNELKTKGTLPKPNLKEFLFGVKPRVYDAQSRDAYCKAVDYLYHKACASALIDVLNRDGIIL